MSIKKALVIYGSPRGEKSSTAVFGHELVQGLKESGALVTEIRLDNKKISPCTGCYTCWTKTPGECVFRDEMSTLLPLIKDTDLVVHVYPLYFSGMPGIMKNFMDRTLPLYQPELIARDDITGHPYRYGSEPSVFLVCGAGFPEPDHFNALLHLYRQLYGERFLGSVLAGGTEMARQESYREAYGRLLVLSRKAGNDLGLSGTLQPETMEALKRENDWPEEKIRNFRETANAWWKSFNPDVTGSVDLPAGSILCKLSDGGASCFFSGMAASYQPEADPDLRGMIQFRFDTGSYFLCIDQGRCEAWKGEALKPLLTLECAEALWYDISEGNTSGEAAVMDGRMKFSGEMGILMRMDTLFGSGKESPEKDSSKLEIQNKISAIPDHRGPIKLPGMVWFNIAFIPWIILWAAEPFLGFVPARLISFGSALLLFLYHFFSNRPTLFEAGNLVYLMISTALSLFFTDIATRLAPVMDPLFLTGLWLGSLLGTFSLTAEYSRSSYPRPVWKQRSFLETNNILVLVWGMYFAVTTALGTIGLIYPGVSTVFRIGGYVLLLPMFLFTLWFTAWYPKKLVERKPA